MLAKLCFTDFFFKRSAKRFLKTSQRTFCILAETQSIGCFRPFYEAKVKFGGSKISLKNATKEVVSTLFNILTMSNENKCKKSTSFFPVFPVHLSLYEISKNFEYKFWLLFQRLLNCKPFFGPFKVS